MYKLECDSDAYTDRTNAENDEHVLEWSKRLIVIGEKCEKKQ